VDDQQGVVVLSPSPDATVSIVLSASLVVMKETVGRAAKATVGGGKRAEALCVGRRVDKIRPWRMPWIGVRFPIGGKGQPPSPPALASVGT
jgi:hypothetical protein